MKTQVYLFGCIFCFFVLFSCSNSKTPKEVDIPETFSPETDWQKVNIKGEVKSIDEYRYYYNYDEDSTMGKGNMESRQVTKYNDKGFVINDAYYGSENYLVSETKQFYNENGLRDTSFSCSGLGELKANIVSFYDRTGLLIKIEHYAVDDSLIYIEEIEYNDNRKPIKIESFVGSDKNASVVSEIQYNDKNQKVQSSYHDIPQDIYTIAKYEYDADGMLIKRLYLDEDENLQDTYEFEYTFDNTGNWITRKEIRNGKIAFIVEREIEYFE